VTPHYVVSADGVEFHHHYYPTAAQRLDGADPASFTALSDPTWIAAEPLSYAGKDKTSVWFMHKQVPDADAQSFIYFVGGQCHWGRDRIRLYCFYVENNPVIKIMKSPAPETFGFFTENQGRSAYRRQYARDAKFVYYYGRRVQGARPETFRRLPNDRLSEGASESDYYVGDQAVYFYGKRVDGADPSCLRVFHLPGLGHSEYAFDRSAFYCNGQRMPDFKVGGNRDIGYYVNARLDLAAEYWSQIPATRSILPTLAKRS
jgi:DKNYY family